MAEQIHPLPQSSTLGIFVCGWFRVEGGLVSLKEKPHHAVLSTDLKSRDITEPEVGKAEMVLAPKMEFFLSRRIASQIAWVTFRRRRHLRRALEEPH